jgi:hypothetical protein
VETWSASDVSAFVTGLTEAFGSKASEDAAAMRREHVNGEALVQLSDGDLREVGLSLGHRKILLARLAALKSK